MHEGWARCGCRHKILHRDLMVVENAKGCRPFTVVCCCAFGVYRLDLLMLLRCCSSILNGILVVGGSWVRRWWLLELEIDGLQLWKRNKMWSWVSLNSITLSVLLCCDFHMLMVNIDMCECIGLYVRDKFGEYTF